MEGEIFPTCPDQIDLLAASCAMGTGSSAVVKKG